MAKRKTPARRQRQRPERSSASRSEYFLQPGKRGTVIVLRKPCGNRATPKVCGTMPSRAQAKMLVAQLEKAESAVNDLFLEATDDGIEALEAVLAACRDAVLRRTGGMRTPHGTDVPTARDTPARNGDGGGGGEPEFSPPREAHPLDD